MYHKIVIVCVYIGSIPSSIGSLTSLVELYLDSNSLTGNYISGVILVFENIVKYI